MKSLGIKVMLISVALGVAVLALAGIASANHVLAVITIADEPTVGQPMEVRAALRSAACSVVDVRYDTLSLTFASSTSSARASAAAHRPGSLLRSADGGLPLEGTSVTFYSDASFGGVDGEVVLGRAVTDESGVAALTYEPRSASQHQIRIEYLPPGESEPEEITQPLSVAEGGSQMYRSSAGVHIPGLNVWLLIAVVSTVWVILLSVALRVIAIARAGGDAETPLDSAHQPGRAGDHRAASQSGASGVS